MGDASEREIENAIGKDFQTLSNQDVVENAIAQLDRVELVKLSPEERQAYARAIDATSLLSERLEERNELPFGVTD